MINNRNVRKRAFAHVHGIPNETSNDEIKLYGAIVENLYNNPNSKYHFHFNMPITDFGVPSKIVRIQDYKDCFIEYVMKRCLVSKDEAIELMAMVETPIRTNALCLDIGKTDGEDVLIVGLESNRGLHYFVPDNPKDKMAFARSMFADMIKEIEISKIATFVEINHCVPYIYGVGSKENVEQTLAVHAFVSEL